MGTGILLAAVNKDSWSPGIGDPTFMGWAIAFGYIAAAIACARAAAKSRSATSHVGRNGFILWALLAAAMLVLGINKQLDLQSLITLIGRRAARAQGWYAARREIQSLFVACVGLAGLAALTALAWLARGAAWPRRLALLGAIYLVSFIVVRAASFHHVDVILRIPLGGTRLNALLEAAGVVCVAIGAYREAKQFRRGPGLLHKIERTYASLRGIDLDGRGTQR